MYVNCKKCGGRIEVSHRPGGGTSLRNVKPSGNVKIEGGKITFVQGGSLSFGRGGSVSFLTVPKSTFTCFECGHTDEYLSGEIKDG